MASLREAARSVLEDAKMGICWIAVWKTGRSWDAEPIYGAEYDEGCGHGPLRRPASWKIDTDAEERLHEILQQDPEAIMINGYYRNIGPLEEMTLETLMDGIRFQYGLNGGSIEGILEAPRR